MSKKILKIISATHLKNYELKLVFQDKKESIVDFHDFLNGSTHSEIRSYLDIEKFKTFRLENGDLMWGDFDLLFPIKDLYDGKISA